MSALVVQPSWQPAPARPARGRTVAEPTRSTRRGALQLVGPGFVPTPAAAPAVHAPEVAATAAQVRPATSPVAPLRLTVRGRRVLTGLALLVATVLSVGLGAWVGTAGSSVDVGDVVTVTVAPGETLWAVAGAAAAPGEDVREVVAEIAELNGLAGADLRAGQQLVVPAG